MNRVIQALSGLLAVCVVVRVGAWLVAPVMAPIAILVFLVFVLNFMLGGSRRL